MTEHYEVTFKDAKVVNSAKYKRAESAYDFMSSVVSAVLFVAVILVFFFRIATVNGQSMEPTLSDRDRLLLTTAPSSYKYGDIVVIHREGLESLVKRVIATPGDKLDIDFEKGIVTVNGTVLDESYIAEPTYLSYTDGPVFPFVVPQGYYFCMGDNRNNSLDSRSASVGLINEQYIIGRMVIDISDTEAK